ncbi:hypothetical protein [Nucisporomicrobium flavum]|uniref:hypothetical protein n=1 Tax=Nucisporomicrobium flavum TaxID=2785915 RepID=UPI0018F3CABC|nr:hypothetical protein [Nucisporomicrobium flavum]
MRRATWAVVAIIDDVGERRSDHVHLVNLNREVPAGTTIPVTFIFARAGAVT